MCNLRDIARSIFCGFSTLNRKISKTNEAAGICLYNIGIVATSSLILPYKNILNVDVFRVCSKSSENCMYIVKVENWIFRGILRTFQNILKAATKASSTICNIVPFRSVISEISHFQFLLNLSIQNLKRLYFKNCQCGWGLVIYHWNRPNLLFNVMR